MVCPDPGTLPVQAMALISAQIDEVIAAQPDQFRDYARPKAVILSAEVRARLLSRLRLVPR